MVARVRTVAFHGVEVIEVETQVTIASGLPAFTVVGLPDKAVAESRERVRAALAVLGLALPPRRITVNLAQPRAGRWTVLRPLGRKAGHRNNLDPNSRVT